MKTAGILADRRSTTFDRIVRVGLELFVARGFDEVTVDDIAEAAGIGRRTFFRYFPSKNDLPWGAFDELVEGMRASLAQVPDDVPVLTALRQTVIEFNTFPPEELPHHRERMRLLLGAPTLLAHSNLRYESWREAIAEFVARRLGIAPNARLPRLVGMTMLAIAYTAYEEWIRRPESDLIQLLEAGFHDARRLLDGRLE